MIDLDEINREINRLEHSETTYANCERLSVLYSVREKYGGEEVKAVKEYSFATAPKSDFITAFKKAPLDEALKIINEHMEYMQLLYPKEYSTILRKLENVAE